MSAPARPLARLNDSLHLVSVAAWLAVLVAAAVAAMAVFSTLPRLDIELPEFRAYFDGPGRREGVDPTTEHGRVAAGIVMEPVFRRVILAELACGAVALVTLAAQRAFARRRWRAAPWTNRLRATCLLVAMALALWQFGVLGPRMNSNLHAWRDAARRADADAATFRADFDTDHHAADTLFRVRLVLVLAALALAGAAVGVTPAPGDRDAASARVAPAT